MLLAVDHGEVNSKPACEYPLNSPRLAYFSWYFYAGSACRTDHSFSEVAILLKRLTEDGKDRKKYKEVNMVITEAVALISGL